MKDKKIYLKLACIFELIYIIGAVIYNLFYVMKTITLYGNLISLIIDFIFLIVMYKESKKNINNLKNNHSKLTLASIWLLFNSIVPGILGLYFINSLTTKKSNDIPIIKQVKKEKTDYIKSIIIILVFLLLMFLLPNIKLYKDMPNFIIYIIILFLIALFNYKELYNNFIVFKDNYKSYFKFIVKRYLIMLGLMIIAVIPIVLFNHSKTSTNQMMINDMFKKVPIFALLLSTIYAPISEECIFRLNLSKLFKNKTIFIIISGVLFGTLHMIDKITSPMDVLYILQYSVLGICLAKAYSDSNNIYVPICIHFIQNFLASVIVLFLR